MVSNSAETSTGVESFDIEYTKENVKSYNEYNIKLFVELSNSISGRALTDDDVWEFINAAEDQYPVTKYGRGKASDELISKIRFEDFFENWCLFYTLRADNTETLTFSGLTKNSVY